jgi:hypothetical protein
MANQTSNRILTRCYQGLLLLLTVGAISCGSITSNGVNPQRVGLTLTVSDFSSLLPVEAGTEIQIELVAASGQRFTSPLLAVEDTTDSLSAFIDNVPVGLASVRCLTFVNGVQTRSTTPVQQNIQVGTNQFPVRCSVVAPGEFIFDPASYDVDELSGSEGDTPDAFDTFAEVTIRRINGSDGSVTLNVATADGTAIAGEDYAAVNTSVTFGPAQTSAVIPIQILNDQIFESTETFTVSLLPSSGALLGDPSTATITILDEPAGTIAFASADVSAFEDDGAVTVPVRRSGGSEGTSTVDFTTENGTAIAGQDYTAVSGTLTFSPGQTTQTISVPILQDQVNDFNETFSVNLSNPQNVVVGSEGTAARDLTAKAALGDPSTAVVTIINNCFVGGTWLYSAESDFSYSPGSGFIEVSIPFDALLVITQDDDQLTFTPFFIDADGTGSGEITGNSISATIPLDVGVPATGFLEATVSDDCQEISGTIFFSDGIAGNSTSTIPFTMSTETGP